MQVGWCAAATSPPENLLLNATLDVFARLQLRRTRFDICHSPVDFGRPSGLRIRVDRPVETGQQLGCNLGAFMAVQAEGFGEDRLGTLRRALILQKRTQGPCSARSTS